MYNKSIKKHVGYIYRHWICIDEKEISYIGRCMRRPIDRWGPHGEGYLSTWKGENASTDFSDAINEYGWDSFSHNILLKVVCDTKDELNFWLNEWEKYYIWYYDSFYNGYNMTLGGDGTVGRKATDEAKKKMSKAKKGRKRNPESVTKMVKTITGTKRTKETRKKMSEKAKGRKVKDSTKEKLSKTSRAWASTEEGKEHYKKLHYNRKVKPGSTSKYIINLETGIIFSMSTHAAIIMEYITGIKFYPENIRSCCKHRQTNTKGFHFIYYNEYKDMLLLPHMEDDINE